MVNSLIQLQENSIYYGQGVQMLTFHCIYEQQLPEQQSDTKGQVTFLKVKSATLKVHDSFDLLQEQYQVGMSKISNLNSKFVIPEIH